MDGITSKSGSDDSDSQRICRRRRRHFMNEQCLDAPVSNLLIDLSEPKWSPYWMGRFKQHPTNGAIEPPNPNPEVLGLENGNGCTRTDHATQTFPSNAINVDPDMVKPKSPCRLTDDSKHKSACAIKTDKIYLALHMPRLPQNSIFANNPELKELVRKYLFKIEQEQEQGGDVKWSSGDGLLSPPEKHPSVSAAVDVGEMHHSAPREPQGRWSQIKQTASSLPFPLPTQAEAACGCADGLVSETRESNPSDSKRWLYSQPSGTSRLDLNPILYQSTVVQDPLTSVTSSEPFHGIKSLSNKTLPTDHSPQVESTVLPYPEPVTSSESFHSVESQVKKMPISAHPARVQSAVRGAFKAELQESTSGSANNLCDGIPGDVVRFANSKGWYLAEAKTDSYCIDEDIVSIDDNPVMVNWHDGSDVEEMYEERSFRTGGQEDRGYVCPVILQKLMAQPFPDQYIDEEEDGGFDAAKVLHSQSLRLVYSTIEESLPEGTVQLLSDLLQPGVYPPKDITAHLLRGLLLGPRCPLHLRVQAFDLLMKTQRHHRTDRSTIPWDWELLSSTMDNQEDPAKRHLCEVVRMLLEYVLRTMEDDFRAKLSSAALKESIARDFLSCTSQVPKVREVIRWLCAAVGKSTAEGAGDERPRETDDHIRTVTVLQRMLRMAVEVDCSPVLTAARLSQELFHALLIVLPLRSHRKLLLDSLQSELLKCKLLQHLLEHSCSEKTALPMSLALLLHFLKHSTLNQEPTDGAQRWPKWEELVELLWMLLLSYNKVNKGDLRRPITETCGHAVTAGPKDAVNRLAVCEAVESLLSRARDDLGQDLPDHIEESLSYLQDHLLDVCQS